ncbi:hypothetical protein BV25DRAFT_1918843 [Artomyces pyxidatus]|uniref:Uncharacterized protein n=1 Tax=Artomyces pyxidatus TaxID=48021 RepID=A0ACB8SQY1_9AGAM|nr:hypothetical protein BV25DRAFT_1918843 [Artomyces pyxidatus]
MSHRPPGDKIYPKIENEISNWYKEFPRTTITAVEAAIKPFETDPSKGQRFVKDALRGAAFWGLPHPTEPGDAFQSPYLLASFAHHIKHTSGPLLANDGTWNATGALLLSILAVQRAFKYTPLEERSMQECRTSKAFEVFLRKPHRQRQLYANAEKTLSRKNKMATRPSVSAKYEVMDVFDRSSPPPGD